MEKSAPPAEQVNMGKLAKQPIMLQYIFFCTSDRIGLGAVLDESLMALVDKWLCALVLRWLSIIVYVSSRPRPTRLS